MISPFSNKRSTIFYYFIIWILIALQHFTILTFMKVEINAALLDSIIFNSIYSILGLGLWYPVRYVNVDESRIGKIIFNHSIPAIISSIIWVYFGNLILTNLFDLSDAYREFLKDSLVWRFNIGIIFYIVLVSLYYVVFYYRSFKEKLEKENQLHSLVKESELRTLKYQINPHFIFNCLNSISSLTISDPDTARKMTIKLSSFLRSTLTQNEMQMNRLKDEIENSKLYMEIEKIRFGDNLDFSVEINDGCENILVPNMILQPLFENAIKHGIYETIGRVTIKLSCLMEKDYLKINVTNNFDPEAVSKKGKGIGLRNIMNRLKLIYNQDNLLTYNKLENIFTANIYIPVNN